ncbi:MAG: AAA family ATPase [Elusimicrobia bacterium]|nr:AAA family ATPase [Elusimicrobiota bacterium]
MKRLLRQKWLDKIFAEQKFMYLKYLEIEGFKAFVGKTRINFEKGITAIVGPNGCGKSNILDAIRWVLCEQNPRNIRCKTDRDVIFKGTASRPSVGLARASLLLDNSTSWLNISASEVLITRKIYANGETGYFINREPVRMKDIKELFMNTGVLANAYSILAATEVEAVLNSTPQQLRILFDEAAGVTKYKFHRDESRRRMDRVTDDLNRVKDILLELESEKKTLEAQARKAKRYERLKEELDRALVGNILLGIRENRQRKEETEKELRSIADETIKTRSALSAESSRLQGLKVEAARSEDEFHSLQRDFTEVVSARKVAEERIAFVSSRLSTLPEEIESAGKEIGSLSEKLETLRTDFAEISARKESVEKAFYEIKAIFESSPTDFNAKLEEVKNRLFEAVRDITSCRNAISSHESRIERLLTDGKNTDESILEFKEQISVLAKKKKEIDNEINRLEEEVRNREIGEEEQDGKISETAEKIKAASQKVEDLHNELVRLRALADSDRLRQEKYKASLKELSAEEGFLGDFEANFEPEDGWNDFFDFFTRNIKILFFENKSAAQAAFGKVNHPLTAVISVEDLMNYQTPDFSATSSAFKPKNEFAEKFLKVFFSNVDFENRSSAENFLVKAKRNGFLELPFGRIASSGGNIPSGKLSDEMKKLGNRILEEKNSLASLEREKEKLDEAKRELSAERIELSRKIIELRAEAKNVAENLNAKNEAAKQAAETKKTIEKDIAEFKEKIKEHSRRIENLENLRAELESRLQALEKTKASAEETRKHLKEAEYEARKQNFAAVKAQWESRKSEIARIETELKDITAAKKKKEGELQYLKDNRKKLQEELSVLAKKEKEISEKISLLKERQVSLREDIKELEKKVSQISRRVYEETSREEKFSGELKHITENLTELLRRLKEEHNLSVEEAFEKFGEPEEYAQDLIIKMKARLEAMGAINLLAPEDYERISQRWEFLKSQSDDLEKAIEDLTKIIGEANKQIKDNFLRVFNTAAENFKTVYKKFFEGGEAKMWLTDEENLIESGVEIMGCPPGKRISALSQLSTGERALTAIALLFALFQVKPSPFCILDEVDAPLDDANVVRFNKLVKDYTSSTQFVIMTHNKRTMEMADVIYGITMEEAGVSKVVSVKYRKFEP